jgi:FAD/FMN-containing dehydrogenase/Fe-S oxidoreductase
LFKLRKNPLTAIAEKINSTFLARRLAPLIRGDVREDLVTRLLFSTDGSIYKRVPAVVVSPRDHDDVVNLVLLAQELNLPIAPRGAGTGLAGESLTTGILIDFSRYMNKITNIDLNNATVTAEPGVILDEINRQVASAGYQFGPDPSSASRATVGGSLANNATGAHSLRYGFFGDNLLSLSAILADGSTIRTGDSRWTDLERKIAALLHPHRRLIEQCWPRAKRNRAGYNLKAFLDHAGSSSLIKLFAGSEGTLGLFTEMTLQLVRTPKVKMVLSANFDNFIHSAAATNFILEYNPGGIELMDHTLLGLARESSPALRQTLPDAQASLMIDFDADSASEAADRLNECKKRLESEFGSHVTLVELKTPAEQKPHWAARKNAVPLLFRRPGRSRPIAFVEDIAVEPEKLPEYLAGMTAIFEKYDVQTSFYGHAGAGEFHIRPFIDLHDPLDRAKVPALVRDAYDLVWSLGGTISGEHGSGLVRSWALRKQYGQAYELMEKIKLTLDPESLLNPGKIIVTDNDIPLQDLRADESFNPDRLSPELFYADREFADHAELCNGCAECKSYNNAQLMCPVFRARGDEYSSPRAKANLLREYLAGNLRPQDLLSPAAQRVLDNCLLCGNCSRECPSAVQIPKLIVELRTLRHRLRGDKLIERTFIDSEYFEWLAGKFAPIVNHFMKKIGVRNIMEKFQGLSARAPMPAFAFPGMLQSLRRLAAKHRPKQPKFRALWFADLFARYHDKHLAIDIVRVCAANGIELIVPEQCGSDMPAIAYGYLDKARQAARYNVRQLSRYLSDIDLILCFEPTATLCLTHEYKNLIDDPDLDMVASKVRDGCDFLHQLYQQSALASLSAIDPMRIAYHTPCHLRQLNIGRPGYDLLTKIPSLSIDLLPDNCCGLAGTFGMNKKNTTLSQTIAEPLISFIRQKNYTLLTTECSACRMQLSTLTGLPALHPIQLLAKSQK